MSPIWFVHRNKTIKADHNRSGGIQWVILIISRGKGDYMKEDVFGKVDGLAAFGTLFNNDSNKWPSRNNKNCRLHPVCSPEIKPSFSLKEHEPIFTIGSCFARHVEIALKKSGHPVPCLDFSVPEDELWSGTKMRSGILNKYTPHSMLNEILSAFNEPGAPSDKDYLIEQEEGSFIDLQLHVNKPVSFDRAIQRRLEIRELFRKGIAECRVVIITLGLVESWWDALSGVYLNETPSQNLIKKYPNRFFFEVLSPEKVIDCTEKIVRLIHKHGKKDNKILITVSPVPIQRTFTDNDVIIANTYSKSVLRVAAEVAARTFDFVDYYPSYESVTLSSPEKSWLDDLVHVQSDMVDHNIFRMVKYYSASTDTEIIDK